MANFTPNYNLKKPLGSENYNVADQNGNMDTIDTALNGIENGLAIVSTGNTHGAITSGQYVYVRRHGSLAEGLYKANSNIAANATLTSSNLSSVSGGLGADVASLNGNIANNVGDISRTIRYINTDSVSSYTIPIRPTVAGNSSCLLYSRYGVWLVWIAISSTPNCGSIKLGGADVERNITSLTYDSSNQLLTVEFYGAIYGGIVAIF